MEEVMYKINGKTGIQLEEYISSLIKNIPEWVENEALNKLIPHILGHAAKIGFAKSGVKTINDPRGVVEIIRLFIVEYLTIVYICEDISKAENVEKDSKAKIEKIKIKIEKMKLEIAKLTTMFMEFEQLEEAIKIDAARDIEETVSELFQECEKISKDIEDIKFKINGSIETLGTQKRQCIAGGKENVTQLIANLALLMIMPKGLALKVTRAIIITGFVIFAGFYFNKYLITKKRLAELRESLEVVNATEDDFEEIYNSIKRARGNCSKYKRYKGMGERNAVE